MLRMLQLLDTNTWRMCAKRWHGKNLEKIKNSDLVIWSAPLYCYGLPSNCKAVIDRMIPLSMPNQIVDSNNQTRHPKRNEKNARHILISSCGFPDREGNFDGLVFQFTRMFGKASPIILCSEAPMLSVAIASFVTVPYLLLVKKAGSEFAKSGNISEQTMSKLNKLMLPADEYRKHADKTFGVK